ncbi:uncharacterized protein KY384_001908 [Bacidia gigantensis]|uniref:uncharacterized protein n=1 Tax=Bacidia gigantensis TaxID=2732470 RepID=UPI001D03A1AF|nr:uncharacterized protein KY384_001908 [Bacidia gigantensis]KAG8533125.1 hypothetical protein KY384_001908 [Bacidia gigantensis]
MVPFTLRLTTPLTTLLNITHPILLAGMAHCSTAPLAAAVTNAGGLGTIGGLGYSPTQLREMIHDLKSLLISRDLPFGVDLALPAVGGTARKTNHDYTQGQLDALIDVVIEEQAALFVSAVGVPPKHVIDRLHSAGIPVMNMVGHPRHAVKAFDEGVDIHGIVVAAGGIFDGRGLAAALLLGAESVWVGTRFVASSEAGCSQMHKEAVVDADWQDTVRTLVVSGRPLRVRKNEYISDWEGKAEEVNRLCKNGVVPMEKDFEEGKDVDLPYLMGQVSAIVRDIRPAREIVEGMASEAVEHLGRVSGFVERGGGSKL